MARRPADPRSPPRPARARARRACAALLAGLACLGAVKAQQDGTVKAAFVFNFVRFTEWPAQRWSAGETSLTVCVWAPDARLLDAMRSIGGRGVDERSVRVVDIDRVDDLPRCHAVFVPDGAMRTLGASGLRKAESLDVLTIGDAEGFAAAGGMIGLVAEGSRMRFDVNPQAVRRTHLRLGAQLMQLGRTVAEAGAPRPEGRP